jgi:RimJ/RimL family protein N-acetyltransferase
VTNDSGAGIEALVPMTDGVVTLRAPAGGDRENLIAGRDEEWRRWLGPGSDDPRPTACIVVAGDVVGWIDIETDCEWLENGEVNLGYSVFGPHRGHGYATRAVELLMRYLGASTPYEVATLLIDSANAASIAVAARAGFVPCGDVLGQRCFKRSVRA